MLATAVAVLSHQRRLSPTALAAWRAREGAQPLDEARLREHVERLAIDEMGERSGDERRHLRYVAARLLDAIDYQAAEWRRSKQELRSLLDAADQHAVAEWCRYVSIRGLNPTLAESSLISWRNGVNVISRGTDLLIFDEYDNWLTGRDQLADAMSQLSSKGVTSWLQVIAPLDAEFERATRFTAAPVPAYGEARALGWWRYRVPVHLSDTLREGFAGRCPAVLG